MTGEVGYKLVRTEDGDRLSLNVCPDPVVYKPCVWTFPHASRGPLCVFDGLDNAENLARQWNFYPVEIWRVQYLPGGNTGVWHDLEVDWTDLERLPRGTRLASAVKLVAQMVWP